jgi:transcriptional regulator with XRE-family HTH domain
VSTKNRLNAARVPPAKPVERRALATAVREIRSRERISQEAIAEAAGFGRGYVSELESGRRRASFEGIVAIADVLGVSMAEVGETFDRARERERRRAERARARRTRGASRSRATR